MNILIIHQRFPGQFKYLTGALAHRGHRVVALGMNDIGRSSYQGATYLKYGAHRQSTRDIHPWAQDFETKIIRAEGCYYAALKLKEKGFSPHIIIAHLGWGESLFLKEVWPKAKLVGYGELYFKLRGGDLDFDQEIYPSDPSTSLRVLSKNSSLLLGLQLCDAVLCPTEWQAASFPKEYQHKITVIHDGVDSKLVQPCEEPKLELSDGLQFSGGDELITYVSRNLEPYRGFHIFIRALPEILRNRTDARIVIVGSETTGYGRPHPSGKSWKTVLLEEARNELKDDIMERVHFVGQIPYKHYISILQLSRVHVYLTYPFILSWSLIEAMSAGCAIVASDTPPVREVLENDANARLVDFFDSQELSNKVCKFLSNPAERARLGASARQSVLKKYDLETVCLPALIRFIERLASEA